MNLSGKDVTSPEPMSPVAIATARLPGVDVARALAVLGMVLVNYKLQMMASPEDPDWLVWLSSLIDGRAATLFVVLAGVGVSLRSRHARVQRELLGFERVALLKRAAFLFVAGLLNLHIWEWDILHFYGAYLALSAFLLNAQSWLLWLLAVSCVGINVGLLEYVDLSTDTSLWSLYGMMTELLFEGLHPVFPWMAFLLMGMWMGRQDLGHSRPRLRILVTALLVIVCCHVFTTLETDTLALGGLNEWVMAWESDHSWLSPTIVVLDDAAIAGAIICLCITLTQRRAERTWVRALVATGQLSFTLYLAHAVAILIPLHHGLFEQSSLTLSIGYSLAFYTGAVMLSVWWRRRWPYGPLEGLIRQTTGRTSPAPWGGERLP